ncbi:MAG: response regulator, partial [Paucibacter sp.]|nr:response regulator [Roseateles sp.]
MLPFSPSALKILLVDDLGASRQALSAELHRAGHQVLEAESARQALALFAQHRPDVVLVDVSMANLDGYAFGRELRAVEPGAWTPIVFLSDPDDVESAWLGMEAGGDDYLIKPVSAMVLHAKLRALRRYSLLRQQLVRTSEELRLAHAQLQQSSTTDALTGLPNRRGLDARLQTELELARREGKPLTLALC